MRSLARSVLILFIGLVFTVPISVVEAAVTIDCENVSNIDKRMVDLDAPLYGPCFNGDSGSLSCSESDTIVGSGNAEKVWNFYIDKGLTPVAVAGIMGNYGEETLDTFDPAIKQNYTDRAIPDGGDGATGFGIAQWTAQSRQAGLFSKIRDEGLKKYYGQGWGHPEKNKTEMPQEDIDKLLLIELNYSWEGDSTKIKDLAQEMNNRKSVSGNNGTTVYFHAQYEKSADNASQIQERITSASKYLRQFGDSAGSAGCAGVLGGVTTIEDAIPWAMKFVEDTKAKYNPGGRSLNNQKNSDGSISLYITNDGVVGDGGGCWGGTYCGQCTALSGWFVTMMTEYTYGGGNGNEVVTNLAAKGVPTGKVPRPFSVFSYDTGSVGHTGVVLGVLESGEVITIENNLSANTLKIFKYNIKDAHPDVRFAYMDGKLKQSNLNSSGN